MLKYDSRTGIVGRVHLVIIDKELAWMQFVIVAAALRVSDDDRQELAF